MNAKADLSLAWKPDAARAVERMRAWWEGEILDRPTLQVTAPLPAARPPPPAAHHAALRDRWMDAEYALDCFEYAAAGTYWGGECLPVFSPNLGPEVIAAAYGAQLEFGEATSWSVPRLTDWSQVSGLAFDPDNEYIRKIVELTRLGLERSAGRYLVGITDLHPGADLAASLRDPQQLCLDLLDSPDEVRRLLERIHEAFFRMYDLQYELLRARGETITSAWLPLYGEGRYYIPSNDFSCMVSTDTFKEFFLPELIDEMRWLDFSIYHLDGPGALRHLDTLLAIPELDAVQWVWGAGHGPARRWADVLRRIQKAGKNVQISADCDDVGDIMEILRPEGVMITTWAPSVEAADNLIRTVAKWKRP